MVRFTALEDQIVRKPGEVTERVTEKVTEKEMQVIELLQEDPGYTYAELADKLSVSRKTINNFPLATENRWSDSFCESILIRLNLKKRRGKCLLQLSGRI